MIWNLGGTFTYHGAENNGGALSIVHHVSEDFCFVETNKKLVVGEGQSVDFLEEDYVVTLAEKM